MKNNITVEIKSYPFNKKTVDALLEAHPSMIYPYVYILENGTDSYVGETTRNSIRLEEHLKKKEIFRDNGRIHIISGEFNESATSNFEAMLIRLMEADGVFRKTNIQKTNFHRFREKQEYDQVFKEIWVKLKEKGLVKEKDYSLVLYNSDLYKYSPCTGLNPEQLAEMDHVINAVLAGDMRPYLISGRAGTGKTVMASALFYTLKRDVRFKGLKIALVVPTPTRETLKEVIGDIDGFHKNQVIGPTEVFNEHYDILICDEVHKMRQRCIRNIQKIKSFQEAIGTNFAGGCRSVKELWEKRKGHNPLPAIRTDLQACCDELDLILWSSTYQILFYDDSQKTNPQCLDREYVNKRIRQYDMLRGSLTRQMRVGAGQDYLPYIRAMLNGLLSDRKNFPGYDFVLYRSFPDMADRIKALDGEYGLCRMCAGYAWPWDSRDSADVYDIRIQGRRVRWNGRTNGWINSPNAVDEMGCIYSVHGFDLNYAGVVIAEDLRYDKEKGEIVVDKDHFYDPFGRKIKADELREYIINIYGVLLSRGIRGTFVYVCDDDLREYLSRFIETV